MTIKYIAGSVALIVCLIAVIIIISMRAKRTVAIIGDDSDDFIDHIAGRKRAWLESKPKAPDYTKYRLYVLLGAFMFFVCGFLFTNSFLIAGILGILGCMVPDAIILIKNNKSEAEYEEQFATSLRVLIANMESGATIMQAVESVCATEYVDHSIRDAYAHLNSDLKLNVPVEDAFRSFASRIKCRDAQDVVTALSLQMNVGGKETLAIKTVARNIANRLAERKEVKAMFAGSNLTVVAMDILPFLIILFLYFASPSYMAPYFESPTLTWVLFGLLAFMLFGSFVTHNEIRKMKKRCGL